MEQPKTIVLDACSSEGVEKKQPQQTEQIPWQLVYDPEKGPTNNAVPSECGNEFTFSEKK